MAASNLSSANVVTGRGVAFGQFANSRVAGVADIKVNKKTGKITVQHVYVASDAGLVVYPDGMHNNEEGAIMQGVSRSLYEQLVFDKKGVTSLDWVSYPMIRFKEAPQITLVALQRTDVPISDTTSVAAGGSRSTGSGEPGLVPIARRDRQRVLRRHGCAHPRGADDAGPRAGSARSGRQVSRTRVSADGGEGPETGPLLVPGTRRAGPV